MSYTSIMLLNIGKTRFVTLSKTIQESIIQTGIHKHVATFTHRGKRKILDLFEIKEGL